MSDISALSCDDEDQVQMRADLLATTPFANSGGRDSPLDRKSAN
jgi:hypothetical protein